MNHRTFNQRGSPSRDRFKLLHKQLMPKNCWALNSDLELVEKYPLPFVVARLDFKVAGDSISFTEAISYQTFISLPMPHTIPVYIIETGHIFKDEDSEPDKHRFDIFKLTGADYRPNPPTYEGRYVLQGATWEQLMEWEIGLRNYRKKQVADFLRNKIDLNGGDT